MSDNAAYTPRKRMFLAIAMWVVLVATAGTAILLIGVKNRLWRVDLSDPQTYGPIEIRLPRNWDVSRQHRGSSDSLQAIEPSAPRRALAVHVNRPDASDPMSLLAGSNLLQYLQIQAEDARLVEEIEVPDGKGIIIHPQQGRSSLAVLAFADGRIVTIQMVSRGSSPAADDAILYNVATSIRLAPETDPQPPSPPPAIENPKNGDREI